MCPVFREVNLRTERLYRSGKGLGLAILNDALSQMSYRRGICIRAPGIACRYQRTETVRRPAERGTPTLRDSCWPLSRSLVLCVWYRWTRAFSEDTTVSLFASWDDSQVSRCAARFGPVHTMSGMVRTLDCCSLPPSMQVSPSRAAK